MIKTDKTGTGAEQPDMTERNSTKERTMWSRWDWILRGAVVFLALVFVCPAPVDSQIQRKRVAEQTEFGADADLDQPIPVPEAGLKALRNVLKATSDDLPAERLQASEVHLDGPTEVDLVVPALAGSHAAFFYILRPASDGYELIFDSGGDSMTILRTRSHGYRDLRVVGITMAGAAQTTVVYRFDGRKYVKAIERSGRS